MKTVAVIGAGIAGLSAAYYLAQKNMLVSVYEQEPWPAMQTSRANGGQLSVSNSETWNTWGNVNRGLRWMLRKDAPLLIRPGLSWHKFTWLSEFLWHTLVNDHVSNTKSTIELGMKNRTLMTQLREKEQINFDYSHCGILHVYRDEKYFAQAQASQELYQASGVQWDILTPEQTLEREPALRSAKNILGSIWTADDSVGDMHKFCNELSFVLHEKYGVRFYFNHRIDAVDQLLSKHDLVVIANGVDAHRLAEYLQDPVNIYPVKGYSITVDLNTLSAAVAPRTSLIDEQTKIVCSRLGDRLRVAGTAELNGYNRDITRSRIEPLLNWVRNNFPEINTQSYNQWTCLRPMTPDMLPIVQPSKNEPRVWYHCGHGHLGWTTSLATAQALSRAIAE